MVADQVVAVDWEDAGVVLVADPVFLADRVFLADLVFLAEEHLDNVEDILRMIHLVEALAADLRVVGLASALPVLVDVALVSAAVDLLFLATEFVAVDIVAEVDLILDEDMVHYLEVVVVDRTVADNLRNPVAAAAVTDFSNPYPYYIPVAAVFLPAVVEKGLHYFQTEHLHPNELDPKSKNLWYRSSVLQQWLLKQLYPLLDPRHPLFCF